MKGGVREAFQAWVAYAIALYIEYPRPMRRLVPVFFLIFALFVSCVATACVHPSEQKKGFIPAADTGQYDELMEYPAPPFYAKWWNNMEQCSGLKGELGQIHWYVAPKAFLSIPGQNGLFLGLTTINGGEHQIILGLFEPGDSTVVHHEMLHELINQNGLRNMWDMHPLELFRDKCGKVVGPGGMG